MVTKITLVRHAQSTGNAKECFTGQTDVDLSELGHKQAELTAQALADEQFTAIYSSDLKRAYLTAKFIAKFHKLDITTTPDLREINLGIFQGKSFIEVEKEYPEEFTAISRRDLNVVIPNGESHGMLRDRVIKAFNKIISNHIGGNILLVVHGGVIFHINHYILGIAPTETFRLSYKISNCSISCYEMIEKERWRLVSFNETAHLNELKQARSVNSQFLTTSEKIFGCS
ncbi:MAG: histidine phosphatase family protein [Blastocatellia bacterium]|nr:histidine phosphatase family protein [Blastocatellia bacterium]MBL8194017.1 histidine phosphatase family protein [Blastocatellia bacterium]MBN8723188.1 histidine phosphatase family protein [Acidobacteriota bacterium]